MLRKSHGDLIKVLAYVVGSLVLGAALAPWVYNVGMFLAELTATKQTNAWIDWVGRAAERSKDEFPRFFDRAVLLAALLLLGPLVVLLRWGRREVFRDTPWSVKWGGSPVCQRGQPLRSCRRGWVQLGWGLLLASGLLFLCGASLVQAGFFMWQHAPESPLGVPNPEAAQTDWKAILVGAIPAAVVVSLLEETLFRGVLLGIFLRAMRVTPAVIGVSLLFAGVHFLEPPPGIKVPDPEAPDAGFILLGHIMARFADPFSMLHRFAILFAIGLVLAVGRVRTASLWLPVGLHAGWVFSYLVFKDLTWPVADLPVAVRWLAGGTLTKGMLPLFAVILTGLVVALTTSRAGGSDLSCEHEAAS